MTWVKICGLTNLEDALVAVEAGADAVGFVFYEKSPRYVTAETAGRIAERLPRSLEKIGVFVNGGGGDLVRIVYTAGLTGMQNHVVFGLPFSRMAVGDVFPKPFRDLVAYPVPQWVAMGAPIEKVAQHVEHLRNIPKLPGIEEVPEFIVVLDSGGAESPGGTGKALDWSKIAPTAEGIRRGGSKLVVAGGLTPENVGTAMEILRPWGVDVASGVEERAGKKDPEKVRAFVRAVREMDGR